MSKKPFFEAMMPTQLVELLFFESVSAGFPSPAMDYMDKKLDLNELCIKNPSATFFIRVQGDSMQEAGIFEGDILIGDRSLRAKNRDIVVAVVEGDFVVKRYCPQGKKLFLIAENLNYLPIIIEEGTDFEIWVSSKKSFIMFRGWCIGYWYIGY